MILARGGMIAARAPAAADRLAARTPHRRPGERSAALVRPVGRVATARSAGAEDLYDRLLKLVEPPLLQAAMEHYGGQCLAAARRLGLHRTTLRKKLDELGIREP